MTPANRLEIATCGERIQALCDGAKQRIFLAAPFVKETALAKLISHVPASVEVRCVTRWRLEEIVSGVSDLGVWPLIRSRPHASLWLRADLHAKYYSSDIQCLIGSANLTLQALGWSLRPNVELLVDIDPTDAQIAGFEEFLLAFSVQVDDSIYKDMAKLAAQLQPPILGTPVVYEPPLFGHIPNVSPTTALWLPHLRHPEQLFDVYGGNGNVLTDASRIAAITDLEALAPPLGLNKYAFRASVGALLLQNPLVMKVDHYVSTPRRFGEVRRYLASLTYSDFDRDTSELWQTLMRWLLYFLPDRYALTVPHHTEVFSRNDT